MGFDYEYERLFLGGMRHVGLAAGATLGSTPYVLSCLFKMPVYCIRVLQPLGVSAVAWCVLQDNWDAAVELFQQLKGNQLGVKANSVTYNILMSACLTRDRPQNVSEPYKYMFMHTCRGCLPWAPSRCNCSH